MMGMVGAGGFKRTWKGFFTANVNRLPELDPDNPAHAEVPRPLLLTCALRTRERENSNQQHCFYIIWVSIVRVRDREPPTT